MHGEHLENRGQPVKRHEAGKLDEEWKGKGDDGEKGEAAPTVGPEDPDF